MRADSRRKHAVRDGGFDYLYVAVRRAAQLAALQSDHPKKQSSISVRPEESGAGESNKVVVYQTNVQKRDPKSWLNDVYRFKP